MKTRRPRSEQAVAGVIEALLLVALAAVVISTIQLVYIPDVMEQRESDHMDVVNNQFATLKTMTDLQSITNSSTPISTMLTLGNSELPYFITARSYGELTVDETALYNINLDYGAFTYNLNSIIYNAYNSYFIQQTYVLQGGGIIVRQPNGISVMRVAPSIAVVNGSDLDISFTLPIYQSISGKNYSYDYGSCFVRTTWISADSQHYSSLNSINITTAYPNAWYQTLYDVLGENVNYSQGDTFIEITTKAKDINLDIDTNTFTVQIGQGWVK